MKALNTNNLLLVSNRKSTDEINYSRAKDVMRNDVHIIKANSLRINCIIKIRHLILLIYYS